MINLFKIVILYLVLSTYALANSPLVSDLIGSLPPKPQSDTFITDRTKTLSEDQKDEIDEEIRKVFEEKGIPIYVVVVWKIERGHSIDEFSNKIFNEWEIGFKEHNYGILFLVSRLDRKMRIELGDDWPADTIKKTDTIRDELILPEFKNENFPLGILNGVKGLANLANGRAMPHLIWIKPWHYIALGIFLTIYIAAIISCFINGRDAWGWVLIGLLISLLYFVVRCLRFIRFNSRNSGSGMSGGSSSGKGSTGEW